MILKFGATCFKSVSQVFFIENVITGALFLAAIAVQSQSDGSPVLLLAVIISTIISNLTAIYCKYDQELIDAGLYGFNGVLLAAAIVLFISHSWLTWVLLLFSIPLSVVVTQALKNILTEKFGIPGSTGPFVMCGWLIIFAAYQMSPLTVHSGLHPHFVDNYQNESALLLSTLSTLNAQSAQSFIEMFLKNIGQVYFLSNIISGALILAGIFVGGIKYGLYAATGSLVAIIVSVLFGFDPAAVSFGLYGFSSVLTAMALGCVFINNPVYAVFGAAITVLLQASLYSITAPFNTPIFTSAYVLCMYLFMAAHQNKGS